MSTTNRCPTESSKSTVSSSKLNSRQLGTFFLMLPMALVLSLRNHIDCFHQILKSERLLFWCHIFPPHLVLGYS